jgi:hypothetical protein
MELNELTLDTTFDAPQFSFELTLDIKGYRGYKYRWNGTTRTN